MKTKAKKWTELTTAELREATKRFDNPAYNPPAVKPSKSELALLRRAQQKAKRTRVAISLEPKLIEQVDAFALKRGITFSEFVAEALRNTLQRRSA